jgi:hypothetical protein
VFLGLPDPDPLVRGMDPDPDPISLSKYSKKNLDFYCFVTSFDFLSLKMIGTVYKSNIQENVFKKISFLLAS